MILPLLVSASGTTLLLVKPVTLHICRRRYDRDVARGIGDALTETYAPPAIDRELLDLLERVP